MNSDEEIPVPPALYEHCLRAYRAMLAESKAVVQTEHQIVVYEGFLTQLITQQLNLSVPYYTSVRKALINMGCIKQLRRGGGSSPSQWEMITEPTYEAFLNQQPKKPTKVNRTEQLHQDVLALSARLSDLEEAVEELVGAWAKHFGAKKVEE